MQPGQPSLPLRDIHLPDGVSWWPLPLGYWLVLFVICVVVISIFLVRYWLRSRQLKKSILRELIQLEVEYKQSNNAPALVQNLSMLLRRIGRAYFPASCESLTGAAWLAFLDKNMDYSSEFQSGVGKVLVTAPYAKQTDVDADALLALCKRWIKQAKKGPARKSA